MTNPEDEDREFYTVQRRTRRPTSEWEAPRFDTNTALARLLASGEAACANDVIADRWVDNETKKTPLALLCQRCPLTNPCLDYALDHDVKGVWGGTTYAQRQRMRHIGRQAPEPVGFMPYLAQTRDR